MVKGRIIEIILLLIIIIDSLNKEIITITVIITIIPTKFKN